MPSPQVTLSSFILIGAAIAGASTNRILSTQPNSYPWSNRGCQYRNDKETCILQNHCCAQSTNNPQQSICIPKAFHLQKISQEGSNASSPKIIFTCNYFTDQLTNCTSPSDCENNKQQCLSMTLSTIMTKEPSLQSEGQGLKASTVVYSANIQQCGRMSQVDTWTEYFGLDVPSQDFKGGRQSFFDEIEDYQVTVTQGGDAQDDIIPAENEENQDSSEQDFSTDFSNEIYYDNSDGEQTVESNEDGTNVQTEDESSNVQDNNQQGSSTNLEDGGPIITDISELPVNTISEDDQTFVEQGNTIEENNLLYQDTSAQTDFSSQPTEIDNSQDSNAQFVDQNFQGNSESPDNQSDGYLQSVLEGSTEEISTDYIIEEAPENPIINIFENETISASPSENLINNADIIGSDNQTEGSLKNLEIETLKSSQKQNTSPVSRTWKIVLLALIIICVIAICTSLAVYLYRKHKNSLAFVPQQVNIETPKGDYKTNDALNKQEPSTDEETVRGNTADVEAQSQ